MSEKWEDLCLKKLKGLQEQNNGVIDTNNIDEIIKQFLELIGSHLTSAKEQEVYHQIEMIQAKFISLKRDISNISLEILDDNFIPDITMDLRSVILQTEKSVTNILDVADEISALCSKVQDFSIRNELMIKSTRILELCNFQDLTGQRIQKIVHHLTEIESVIYKMLHALRPESNLRSVSSSTTSLLNGPQKEENSPSQSDIDDLFNNL